MLLVPTEELALQLLAVCRSISTTLPFRVVAVTGRGKRRTQRQFLDEGVDVVIATPGRLTQLLEEGALRLDVCHAVVLDEVDVLLGAQRVLVLRQRTAVWDGVGWCVLSWVGVLPVILHVSKRKPSRAAVHKHTQT